MRKKIIFILITQSKRRLITASVMNTKKDISKATFADISKIFLTLVVSKNVSSKWSAGKLQRNCVAVIALDQIISKSKKGMELSIQDKLKEMGENFHLPYYKKFKL